MRIKVLYKSGIENTYKYNGYEKAYFVEVESEDTCMMNLFMEKGSSTIVCFDEYYPYPYNWTTLGTLPYCQKNGQYYWNIDLKEISIRDFMATHDLREGEPIKVCFYGLMGKGDFFANLFLHWHDFYSYAKSVWNNISPVIDGLGKIVDLISVANFIKSIVQGFQKESKNKPYVEDFFFFLSQKRKWYLKELSKKTNLSPDILKFILLVMGFDIQGNTAIRNDKRMQAFKKEWIKYCNVDFFGDMNYCSINTANVGIMYIYVNYPEEYQKIVNKIEEKLSNQDVLYFDKYKREICFIKDEHNCNQERDKMDMVLWEIGIAIELFLEDKES